MKQLKYFFKKQSLTTWILLLIVLLVVALYIFSYSRNMSMESFLIRGEKENFESMDLDKAIQNRNNAVFVFHKMEGCGHCVNFKPTWDKVTQELHGTKKGGKTIHMHMVDASHDLSADVQGFPTIRYYRSADDYEDMTQHVQDRSEASLKSFIQKMIAN